MWINEKDTSGIAAVIFFVVIGLSLIIVIQALRLQSAREENKAKITELAQIKVTMKNPKVTKDPGFHVVYSERKINLTEMEREAIAQQYQMQIDDLQAIIDAVVAKGERTVTITKTGKQTSEPIFYPETKQKRIAVTAEVFNHDLATLGVGYEIIPKWGLSLGIAASNSGKLGGTCAIRF